MRQRFHPRWCRLAAGLYGPGTHRSTADTQAGAVRAVAGQRHDRSVSLPGEHLNAEPGGGHRVPADQQAEDPEAAGPPAEPRTAGLRHIPAVPGGVQLGSGPTAGGAPDQTWTGPHR